MDEKKKSNWIRVGAAWYREKPGKDPFYSISLDKAKVSALEADEKGNASVLMVPAQKKSEKQPDFNLIVRAADEVPF